MKFDSESPYQHTRPSQEHDDKLIVHCDNPFILAKDNHFMIDMFNIDNEALKEGKHGHKSHIERKSSKVMCPPKQHLNIENNLNINKSDDECMEALYSSPASDLEMVVKEDLYTDQIVTKAELTEVRVCIEDDPCHIVRDISIDKGLHFSNKSSVEKKEVSAIEASISNQTLKNGTSDKSLVEKEKLVLMESCISNETVNNGHDDSKSVMAGFVGSDGSKYTVFESSISNVDKGRSDPVSILHNAPAGNGSYVGSFDFRDMLVISNDTSAKVTDNLVDPSSVIYNDYDGKDSYASSINSEGNVETTKTVACDTSAEVTENQAVPSSDVHYDCDAEGSYVSSIDSQNQLGSYESAISNAYGKGSSMSSINSEGNLNTTTSMLNNISVEVTKYRVVSVLDDHNDFDEDGSHGSSICSVDKVDTDESVVNNISGKESSVSSMTSINSEGCLDTKSMVANTSAEVIDNRAVPISDVHSDWEGKESYNSSVDGQNKLDTYKSVVSNVYAEVVENQLPPSHEITADLSHVNSSSQTSSNNQKQSVDGQEFQTVSEVTNSVCPALKFPSEVPAFSNGSKGSSVNCKVPSGVITFSFDTEEASTSGRDESIETTNNQKSVQSSLGNEEATIDGPSASIRCSSLRFIPEELNLYGPALLSGHNANSGNMLYSGSVSLRSESSTTSTRSFAFPILQSEWNSSPVKMAKADRRHKHRGWKMGLVCCRF